MVRCRHVFVISHKGAALNHSLLFHSSVRMSSVKINYKGKDVDISVSPSMTVAQVKEQVASEFDLGVHLHRVCVAILT